MRFTHQPTSDGAPAGPAVEYADPDEALTITGLEAKELSRQHRLLGELPNRSSERCSLMLPLKRYTIN